MVPNDKNIVVEVPSISSVVFQLNEWDGRQVSYRIGKIFYPDPTLDSKTVPAPP